MTGPGTALVTGGASGIGLATVNLLIEDGWSVVAVDRDEAQLAALPAHARLRPARLDVTDEAAIGRLVGEIETAGPPLRGVVNSAGIAVDARFLDTTPDMIRRMVEVNLIGTFLVGQAAARAMRDTGGGAIVNVASVSGLRGNISRSAYGASKGGVVTLTQIMAVELAPLGIRVNAIAPGPVETPMVAAVHTDEVRAGWGATVPMRRYGVPEEIAGGIAHLLDARRAGYTTGQILAVDGGFTAGGLIG
ncbi:SDR family NAD(P)-dependent oxidoreductase [Marinivivus vitaminiproducens]|uniref:SDR family NAD(P)-dependent oxidoreductase n=1 Tax=Marinivivus vitaminiproducens TaxID=3035935 RepID=UPI0027AAC5CF|nr:SDR family NAD(P)-dependent oxidoreductase [Geminicoccaceae bacterium SCSIO 64248]